ncbi:hypothetical protein BG004_008078, partial [Podila humilis]
NTCMPELHNRLRTRWMPSPAVQGCTNRRAKQQQPKKLSSPERLSFLWSHCPLNQRLSS